LGLTGVADQVAELDLELPDPPVDRGEHPAVIQVDLSILHRGGGPGDVGLGGLDVDGVIGDGLSRAGPIGVDLGRALLALGFGLIEILLRRRLAREQVARPTLLDLVEAILGMCQLESRLGYFARLRGSRLLERGAIRAELGLRLVELDLKRLFFDDEQELILLDVPAIFKVLFLEETADTGADRDFLQCARRTDRADDDRQGHLARFRHDDGWRWRGSRRNARRPAPPPHPPPPPPTPPPP